MGIEESGTSFDIFRKPLVAEVGILIMADDLLARWMPRMLSVLRVVAAVLFIEHGTQKLFGYPPSAEAGPALASLLGIQGILEFSGGALLLIGLFTRIVAFILSGDMAVAYFMVHLPKSTFPVLNGGDAAILYCFIFLYFVFAGGGAWSADAMLAPLGRRARLS